MQVNDSNPISSPPPSAPAVPKTATRIKILESGPVNAKEVTVKKQNVRIQTTASNKVQALSVVRQLEQQIAEAELTLKAIQFAKKLIKYRAHSGQTPSEISIRKDLQQQHVPQNLQHEIIKVYAFTAGTFGKPDEIKAETLTELAKTQFEYVQALRVAHENFSSQLPDMKPITEESIAESTAFAKQYLSDPKNKFIGENGILKQMEEGDRITLSRRKLADLGQGIIPHSVIIIKDKASPEGYRLMFTPHDQDLGRTVMLDKANKKGIGLGSFNKVSRLAAPGGSSAINRQPKVKNPKAKIDEIREAKVMEDMKGKSDYVALPIGTEPKRTTQENIKPLLVDTAFKVVRGQIMERFTGGDGEGYIGFDIKTNTSKKVPSAEVGLQLIDSMTHAFADLHANDIFQLDVKLQNTGVFETTENGKPKATMVIHDFGQAANLNHPTGNKQGDETTTISVQGTPLYMSPEQAATGAEQQQELDALYRDLDDPSKDKAETQRKITALLRKTYSKMDCYSMALNAFTLMTGKLPSHLYDIYQKSSTPYKTMAEVSGIKLDIEPDNVQGQKLREEFTSAARAQGYDDQLISLVLRGLNTDASKRPSAADFQAYFAAKKTQG